MSEGTEAYIEGRCACGGVRYRLLAPPMFVHCCHCTWCQRESGTAFAVNALIESSKVELLAGSPASTLLPSASGRGQAFFRCPDCGVTLWSHYPQAGDVVNFVRVGTLDDPAAVRPDIHIYTSTKQPWVVLPEDVPAVPEFYPVSERWPAESLARLKGARG